MTEKQAKDARDDAKRKKDKAQENADYYKRLRNQTKNDISAYKKEVNNLDDRLADLNRIIKFFEKSLADQCDAADRKAIKASDTFASAVFMTECSFSNASLSTAFGTDTVYGNNNTNNAYNVCVKERNRVSTAIANLEDKIKTLKSQIANYDANITKYKKQVSQCESDMRYYQRFF